MTAPPLDAVLSEFTPAQLTRLQTAIRGILGTTPRRARSLDLTGATPVPAFVARVVASPRQTIATYNGWTLEVPNALAGAKGPKGGLYLLAEDAQLVPPAGAGLAPVAGTLKIAVKYWQLYNDGLTVDAYFQTASDLQPVCIGGMRA